jgi:choline dehydrogenase-like flavoprotein
MATVAEMSDYDAIVIGAGHNGLTAATVMARGGMRVLCLEKNHFIGGIEPPWKLWRLFRLEGKEQCPHRRRSQRSRRSHRSLVPNGDIRLS